MDDKYVDNNIRCNIKGNEVVAGRDNKLEKIASLALTSSIFVLMSYEIMNNFINRYWA